MRFLGEKIGLRGLKTWGSTSPVTPLARVLAALAPAKSKPVSAVFHKADPKLLFPLAVLYQSRTAWYPSITVEGI